MIKKITEKYLRQEFERRIIQDYLNGKSTPEIATESNLHAKTIYGILIKHGIDTRKSTAQLSYMINKYGEALREAYNKNIPARHISRKYNLGKGPNFSLLLAGYRIGRYHADQEKESIIS